MGGFRSLLLLLVIPCLLLSALLACGRGGDSDSPVEKHSVPADRPAPPNPLAGGGPEPANPLAAGGGGLAFPHGELAALEDAESARVKETLGADAGVRVVRVTVGGPLEAAGLRAGDILVALGGAPVGSPVEAMARLTPGAGEVDAAWLRPDASGEWAIRRATVRMPSAAAASPAVPGPSAALPTEPGPAPAVPAAGVEPAPADADRSLAGCVGAYFRLLDFCRSEAWGRRSETPIEVVRYATARLRESLAELSAEERAAVGQLPDAWALLREKWQEASPEVREQQREYWRDQMILPNPLLPLPGPTTRFQSEAGHHEFDYPAGWIRAETQDEGVQYLFVAPPVEAQWAEVAHPATCPPGALFAISPMEDDLRAAKTVEAGARLLARKYVTAYAPGLREVAVFRAGPGAIAVLRGVRPGETEETFCWLGAMPFGSEKFLAARFMGPVGRAEELLPAFSRILATMEVSQPNELADLTVSLAASMIGNAVMAASWHD